MLHHVNHIKYFIKPALKPCSIVPQDYTRDFILSQHAGHPLIPRSQATEHSMAPLLYALLGAEWKEYSTLNGADQKSGIAFSNAQLQLCRKNAE